MFNSAGGGVVGMVSGSVQFSWRWVVGMVS